MIYFQSLDDFYNQCLLHNSAKDLSKVVNVSVPSLYDYLNLLKEKDINKYQEIKKFWELKRKEKIQNTYYERTTYTLNDYAFDEITEESAYWLGMFASDGCVHSTKNLLSMTAKADDKEHLQKFADFLQFSGTVKDTLSSIKGKKYPSVYINFYSKLIKEKLKEYGIVPAKSNLDIDYLSFIPDNYKIYFVFGYLDGDGTISRNVNDSNCKTYASISFLCNYSLAISIQKTIEKFVGKKPSILKEKRGTIQKYICQLSGMEACLVFFKEYVKHPFILERKRKRAEAWIEYIEKRLEEKRIQESLPKPIRIHRKSVPQYKPCPICGKQIQYDSKHCVECTKIVSRKVERPTKEELSNLILQYPMTKIGEMYGVSDKAVVKWCKYYDLPSNYYDIKAFRELHKQSQEESSV